MYSIGIDPGVNGAITILDNNGSHLETHVMPMVIVEDSSYKHWYNIQAILDIFCKYNNSYAVLEYQRPMANQGVMAMFRLGRGFGLLEGLCTMKFGSNLSIIDPNKWQNTLVKKYMTKKEADSFKSKTLNYEYIIQQINDNSYKEWYIKQTLNKSASKAKLKTSFLFYKIKNTVEYVNINWKNNNLVDSYLLARYIFENHVKSAH